MQSWRALETSLNGCACIEFYLQTPESWEKLKPVSPVLLSAPKSWPPPANMAVRCGDIPRSATERC